MALERDRCAREFAAGNNPGRKVRLVHSEMLSRNPVGVNRLTGVLNKATPRGRYMLKQMAIGRVKKAVGFELLRDWRVQQPWSVTMRRGWGSFQDWNSTAQKAQQKPASAASAQCISLRHRGRSNVVRST